MSIELQTLVGIAVPICSLIIAIFAFSRTKKKDSDDNSARDATVLTDIGYIKSGVDDIKRKQEKQDAQNLEFITRLTSVEASSKQAHKRLDDLNNEKHREG